MHHPTRTSLLLALTALPLLFAPALRAQAVAPASTASPTGAKGQAATAEAVLLNVFEVKGDASDTYDATNTNSVTGTNTLLSKTPLDAKVFNRQLMDELDVVDMTDMLSKLGGLGSAVIGAGEDVRGDLEGDRQDPKNHDDARPRHQ